MHGSKANRGGAKVVRQCMVKQADADTTKAVPAKSAAMKLAAASTLAKFKPAPVMAAIHANMHMNPGEFMAARICG
jgi:hypothetical protein